MADHEEESMDIPIWDVGDTIGRVVVDVRWDVDSSQIHRPQLEDGGTGGDSTSSLRSLWWRLEVLEEVLRANMEESSREARTRQRQWEPHGVTKNRRAKE